MDNKRLRREIAFYIITTLVMTSYNVILISTLGSSLPVLVFYNVSVTVYLIILSHQFLTRGR